ncbi:MAG: PspC domain-containing protein [Ignavibacteriae bacterium]|nr:PspC domain-containing protein [Ignavibacteriota bacterium]
MSPEPKRLYRSRTNKVIAGVCGGVAEYLGIDATLVRVLWVLFTIFGGGGLLLYIAALIIVPQNPTRVIGDSSTTENVAAGNQQALQIIGFILLGLGVFFLFVNLDFFSFKQMMRFVWNFAFPAILIGIGILLLMRRKEIASEPPPSDASGETPSEPTAEEPPKTKGRKKRGETSQNERTSSEPPPKDQNQSREKRQLLRSVLDRKLFGVCGGLGEYFDVDPTIMRILFVIVTLMSFGFGILLYLALLLVMPEKPRTVTP